MNVLKKQDPQVYQIIKQEEKRISETLELIPSNNFQSKAVLQALGTIFNYKYSEGYPHKRYYQGQEFADDIEILAQERAKKLFGVPHANVQPYSGSPAVVAVYLGLLKPGDTIMGLSLPFGGHLTHGALVSASGKYYRSVQYNTNEDGIFDYDAIEKLAVKEKPKIIVCGATAYPRIIDFKRFSEIAEKVKAYLLADVSHISGLIIAGVHPSPVPYVDVVVTTTHKTLRGPRGGIIMVTEKGLKKDADMASKIDKAVFPGLQGGPHDNQTAAIAVALKEASSKSFQKYGEQIVANSKALAKGLIDNGFNLVSGGTDNHLILIDLSNKKANGALAAYAMEVAGLIVNKNAVPNDPMPPFYPSGIRLGTAASTTRGMKEKEMKKIAQWISEAIDQVKGEQLPFDKESRREFWKTFKINENY